MQQSSTKSRCREGVVEDCCMLSILLAVPSCTYSFWHGVIPTSYFIHITLHSVNEQNVPCAVCYTGTRVTVMMIPAKIHCPSGWTVEYTG